MECTGTLTGLSDVHRSSAISVLEKEVLFLDRSEENFSNKYGIEIDLKNNGIR